MARCGTAWRGICVPRPYLYCPAEFVRCAIFDFQCRHLNMKCCCWLPIPSKFLKKSTFLSQTGLFTVPIPIPYTFKWLPSQKSPKTTEKRREPRRIVLLERGRWGAGNSPSLGFREVLFLMEGVRRNRSWGNETQRNRQKSARTPQRLTRKCTIDAQLFQIHYIFKWFIEIVKLRLSL